jgi:hypothetical protein
MLHIILKTIADLSSISTLDISTTFYSIWIIAVGKNPRIPYDEDMMVEIMSETKFLAKVREERAKKQ